jgi:hypothetical protein
VKYIIPILLAAIAGVGAMFTRLDLMLLFLIAAIAAAAIIAAREMRTQEDRLDPYDLDPETRILLRPIRRLHEQIEEVVNESTPSATLRILGPEALAESKRILDQSLRLLQIRSEMKRTLRGSYESVREKKKIAEQMEQATSEQERDSLNTALEARSLEQQHYQELEATIGRVDAGLRQAEAALSEMRARLAVAAKDTLEVSETDDELRESMSRLKALSTSFDEAEEMLRGRSA